VDEQRRGPYRKWIHEHTFTPHASGCEMHDYVGYSVPGGWLANLLFVQRDVRRIFEYRLRKLSDFSLLLDKDGLGDCARLMSVQQESVQDEQGRARDHRSDQQLPNGDECEKQKDAESGIGHFAVCPG